MDRFVSSCRFLVLCATLVLSADVASAGAAGGRGSCDAAAAATLRGRGDDLRSHGAYARAGTAYLAASRRLEACPDASASLLAARSLAQAGAAFAFAGDYVTAHRFLSAAQSRLSAIAARDPKLAADAQASIDQVQNVIAALENVERSSM